MSFFESTRIFILRCHLNSEVVSIVSFSTCTDKFCVSYILYVPLYIISKESLYILYQKNHFTTSESSAQEYGRQIEEMRVEVAKQESLVMELKRQIQEKKEKLDAMKKRLERQQAVSKEDKVGISNRNKHHHLKIFNFPFKM